MTAAKSAILPVFLFLCLLLGGSSQGIWANAILQVLAAGVISWALLTRDPPRLQPAARNLLVIVAATALLFAIQLVPLPPALWELLPGREFLVKGFALLGLPPPWMTISLAPDDTIAAGLTLLPPLALLLGMLRTRAWSAETMFVALLAGVAVSIALGVLQVKGGEGWYFYKITNVGQAVGTFANANHFATLLLIALPILCAVTVSRWRTERDQQRRSIVMMTSIAAAATLLVGILMCRSAAFLLIGPPVAAATAMLAMRMSKARVRQGFIGIFALILLAAGALVLAGDRMPGWGTSASVETRKQYWATSIEAAGDQLWTGWGFGTFQQAYRSHEDPEKVDRFYVNHAHNDYAEIAIEGGIPALLLVAIFLLWWAGRARGAWTSASATVEQKAAAIASAAILLHSLFDFPLRTAAIAGALAVCLALLAGARGTVKRSDAGDRPRHATL